MRNGPLQISVREASMVHNVYRSLAKDLVCDSSTANIHILSLRNLHGRRVSRNAPCRALGLGQTINGPLDWWSLVSPIAGLGGAY